MFFAYMKTLSGDKMYILLIMSILKPYYDCLIKLCLFIFRTLRGKLLCYYYDV